MTKAALLDLADRCEKATGPDRELDGLIRCAVLWDYEVSAHPARRRGFVVAKYEDGHSTFSACRYTASLDAAMTLCPDGFAVLCLLEAIDATTESEEGAWKAALPRFLTAAALRARASMEEADG